MCAIFAQAQFRLAVNGTPSWTNLGGGLYSATMTFHADLTGNSYAVAGIVDTMRLFTSRGQVFEVDSVWGKTFSQATLRVEYVSGVNSAPVGQGMVYAPNPNGFVPDLPFGSTGATAQFNQMPVTYNASLSAAGGGGTVTSVGLTMPSGFSVSGSPVTGTGTLAVTTSLSGLVKASGGAFTAGNVNLASEVTGALGATNGGTGQTSYTVGDLLFANTTTTLSKLADVATGNALISGGVGVAPSWGKVGLTTHVSGTLPVANGGTGASSLSGAGIVTGSGTVNYLPKWTSATEQGNSNIFDNGTSIGINTASPSVLTQVHNYKSITNASNHFYAHQNEVIWNVTTDVVSPKIFSALRNDITLSGAGGTPNSTSYPRAFQNGILVSGSSTANHFNLASIYNDSRVTSGSSGTITNFIGIENFMIGSSTGAQVTNMYAFRSNTSGAGVSNFYGLYLNAGIGTTSNWGIYQAGTGDSNYFAGNTSFGNATSQNAQVFVQANTTNKPGLFVFTNLPGYVESLSTIRASIAGSSAFNLIQAQTSNGGVTQFSVRGDGQTYYNGNVGIGTTSPAEKLSISGNVLLSGVLKNADGTSSIPSYTFTNDLDVGLYRPTTNTLAATVGGTEGWRINSTGFGVFTIPSYGLDINTTDGARIPGGTTAQRPTNAARVVRYNSDTETLEWANGTVWFNAISGIGSANRVAYWSGGTGLTSSGAFTFNGGTGQLTLGNYTSQSAFTGTSVAELHVTSSGAIITKTPRDTVYVTLTSVSPGTSITQTAGFDFYNSVYLVPADMNGYQISRASYAITNSTATSGTLTVGLRQYSPTNTTVAANLMAVSFNGATSDVRKESTSALTLSTGQWIHAEVHPSIAGTLNNVNEGLIITLTLVK